MKFNPEQVIEMRNRAEDAATVELDCVGEYHPNWDAVAYQHFASIAADAALEAAAKVVEPSPDHRMRPQDYLGEHQGLEMCDNLADAIRAMKEKP